MGLQAFAAHSATPLSSGRGTTRAAHRRRLRASSLRSLAMSKSITTSSAGGSSSTPTPARSSRSNGRAAPSAASGATRCASGATPCAARSVIISTTPRTWSGCAARRCASRASSVRPPSTDYEDYSREAAGGHRRDIRRRPAAPFPDEPESGVRRARAGARSDRAPAARQCPARPPSPRLPRRPPPTSSKARSIRRSSSARARMSPRCRSCSTGAARRPASSTGKFGSNVDKAIVAYRDDHRRRI